MNDWFRELVDESIKLELNAADLYMVFYEQFPDDSDFWWKLVIEEKNHAALIKSIRDIFQKTVGVPERLFAQSLREIRESNRLLEEKIREFREAPPSREKAFTTALHLENSAGEAHFQEFMENNMDHNRIAEVFRKLNGADRDHAERIKAYMLQRCIKPV